MDNNKLKWLGFTAGEINIAMTMYNNSNSECTPSVNKIQKIFNVDYRTAQRTRYLYTIIIGNVTINVDNIYNIEEMKPIARHFAKINEGRVEKTYLSDLKPSRVVAIPRMAVVGGIEIKPYNEFNSKGVNLKEFMLVEKITQSSMTLRTYKRVALKYDRKGNYGVDGIIKVIGKDNKDRIILEINKEYCRLCNRYEIVASMIMPKNHFGSYAIVTAAGDIVYVYCKMVKSTNKINKTESERVYDFGIIPSEIKKRTERVAKEIYTQRKGVFAKYFAKQADFKLIGNEKDIVEDDLNL